MSSKLRPGRPPAADVPRDRQVHVRATSAEVERWRAALRPGEGLSDAVRKAMSELCARRSGERAQD